MYAPAVPAQLGQVTDEAALIKSDESYARQYLRDRWQAFLNLSPRIIDLQHRAAEIAYAAGQAGDLERKAQAQDVIRALGELNQAHNWAVETFELERMGDALGLGAVPWVVGGALGFSAVALVVLWAFKSYEAQARKLDLIEAGVLTPEQAAALDPGPAPASVLGGLSQLVTVVAWAAVAWMALQAFRASRWASNPPLEIWHANPPETFGERVYDVRYRHTDDGLNYIHEFGPDVELEALDDGSVRLYHRRGRPLWADFDVE